MAETTTPTRGFDIDPTSTEMDWSFKGKNYLLVIGIDEYKHWKKLNCAVKDIDDFTKVLLDRYQFNDDDTIVLTNKKATLKNILKTLRQLSSKVTEEDNLIVYFSGHGHFDKLTKSAFWIPVSAKEDPENEHEFLNTAIVVEKLNAINSLHTVLIIDACFSGTLLVQLKSGAMGPQAERFKSRRVLTSGRAEVVMDGPVGGNSPFAKGIIMSLATNVRPYLRFSQLIVDVKNYVEERENQVPTDAVLINSDDAGGDFIFHLKVDEDEMWSRVVEKHTLELYEKFLDTFPNSKHADEAKEAVAWLGALEAGTVASIQKYLDEWMPKKGKYISLALNTQQKIEMEDTWKKAKQLDTVSAYNKFIHSFSDSPYVEEAGNLIKAKGSRPSELHEVKREPRTIVKGFSENDQWADAQKLNTYAGYNNFVQAFPNGELSKEANKVMQNLDNIAFNKINVMKANVSISLSDKIELCNQYFKDHPGGKYLHKVKQIKDRLEIERIKKKL